MLSPRFYFYFDLKIDAVDVLGNNFYNLCFNIYTHTGHILYIEAKIDSIVHVQFVKEKVEKFSFVRDRVSRQGSIAICHLSDPDDLKGCNSIYIIYKLIEKEVY